MADRQDDNISEKHTTSATQKVEPHVNNANRIVFGFPFSSIKFEDAANAAQVADVVARLCHLLAESASGEAFADLAAEAEDLVAQLRH